MMNPATISVLLGIAFIFADVRLPELLNTALTKAGASATPLAMIYLGGMLCFIHISDYLKKKEIYLMTAVKMILMPLAVHGILVNISAVSREIAVTISILCALPTMSSVAMTAESQKSDSDYAAGMIFATTIFSVVTLPVVCMFFLKGGEPSMKIYAFEVRKDEEETLRSLASENHAEIEISPDILTKERILCLEKNSAVTVLGMHRYGEEEMEAFARREIHFLSTRTIGYNHIDLTAAKKYGVHVCHAMYEPNGVADYTVMMILLCLRCYKQALWRMQVNDFSLNGLMGREMKDLTIGIIGTGRIGTQVLENLSGFGCRLLCYGRHPNQTAALYAKYVSLEEIYQSCDIISVHLALTEETRHMINRETISRMKKGVVLINCARGALMDTQALIEGIEEEQIGALGLDTIEEEEDFVHLDRKTDIFSDRSVAYLRQFKNVVYTYHMAFYTDAAVKSMAQCGIQGLLDMAAEHPCRTRLC